MSSSSSIHGQRGGEYIYGKITTKSDEQYIGFMRWGKQEFMWHDVFNSNKVQTKHNKRPRETSNSLWDDFNWNLSSIWEDKYRSQSHLFACFFGDIRAIYPLSGNKIKLELKNGSFINLNGGSDDIGGSIYIYDYELGRIKLKWSKIDKIEFTSGPAQIDETLGYPLYGKVKTYRNGTLEGYIKWDLDERTSEDILDGKSGKDQIAFKNIKSIKKKDHGALIGLVSGREVFFSGSNDVNSGNRGIAVYVDGIGNVEVPWSDFKYAQFYDNENEGLTYDSFEPPMGINAEIITVDDDELTGLIVFDIDEKWEMEFLDGDDDKIQYQVPIRNIKKIVPKNKTYSQLYLKNGEILLLGEGQDVSAKNDGILLFLEDQEKPHHIKWRDILQINFK